MRTADTLEIIQADVLEEAVVIGGYVQVIWHS